MSDDLFSVPVTQTLALLLKQEDLDKDLKITKEDLGPKKFHFKDRHGKEFVIDGHYPLSNLLQKLAHAHAKGCNYITLSIKQLNQPVLDQLTQEIKNNYWDQLTRKMNVEGLVELLEDSKRSDEKKILYVPHEDERAYTYFSKASKEHSYLRLKVKKLPKKLSVEALQKINLQPGLLTLSINANPKLGNPYVVPGGRFNEMYGWDSYFIIQGLLLSKKYSVARSMFKHLMYQIKHYHKILNANRSYYLTRSQPPFLTSILRLLIDSKQSLVREDIEEGLNLALKEYFLVWLNQDRLCENGLSRYFGTGFKEPLEVEPGHFDLLFKKFAAQKQMPLNVFRDAYNSGALSNLILDEYFMHDRSMRESGHDSTHRLIGVSAHLNTVDLNSLLYKYECDFYYLITTYFGGMFTLDNFGELKAETFLGRAKKRATAITDLMWDGKKGLFYDYNFIEKKKTSYQSATTFYPLFANLATEDQAKKLIERALPLFETFGGITSTTEKSRGPVHSKRPLMQWDYPFGWAPHQMLFWQGASHYGYSKEVQRLCYKWLYMVCTEAKDYNGAIVEKYDVVEGSHKKTAEYGNEGLEFGLYPSGGFGWVNASILVAQNYLTPLQLRALRNLKDPNLVLG